MVFDLMFLSSSSLFIAFFMYIFATIFFFLTVTGKKWGGEKDNKDQARKWGKIGYSFSLIGFILHLLFEVFRWIAGGHAPTSNMFEFTTFLAFAVVLAFLIIYLIYKKSILGLFVMPLVVIIIAYASVFPRDVSPLIPALKSYWLYIHVTVAALGEGAFAVAFAAGLMYLIHKIDQSKLTKENAMLEVILWAISVVVAFIILAFVFRGLDYHDQFTVTDELGYEQTVSYTMPAIFSPYEGTKISDSNFGPFFETPGWMHGVNAGNKLNTVVWSVLGGTLLYFVLRLIARQRLSKRIQNWLVDIDADTVDEISYRAIAIGFPIFTLGALVFAMIWAAEAWGRPWGWDPKEVWALITWLFYAVYLHLRLSMGWHGKKSAWLATLGFVIVMFTLVGVNLIIAGLHSYA